jgi:hypothetical protein
MIKTTCFGQHWPSSGFSSERIVCCKSVYINHAAEYRCGDLIIEEFELNMANILGAEPSDVGMSQLGGAGGGGGVG